MTSVKRDINKAGWEQSDFPILCETCLGDNPYIRMTKQEYGKTCGTCARPYTVFRWNPGAMSGTRMKATVVCQTCAKVKNICQTCLLDLEYGLPVQVRDTALGLQKSAPTSAVNREYFAQNHDGKEVAVEDSRKAASAGKEMLKQLARTDPYYKRNRPQICSFFVKGTCNRGDECPYRHEMPTTGPLAKQNIQDRYHGRNDPVAHKILAQHAATQGLQPPEDQSITSLFLTSLPASATQESIRVVAVNSLPFLDPSAIRSVVHVVKTRCAFVNFTNRMAAERAAEAWANGLDVDGERAGIRWGKSKKAQAAPSKDVETEA